MEKPRAVFRDYYYILGLKPGASQGQIQAAYSELYAKFGPHVSAEELDPDAMLKAYKDITEAYEVLMDPAKRREYDRKALQSRQDSSDLRDLWLKKAGMAAGDAAREQETSPSSWIKKTTTGSNPAIQIEPEEKPAQPERNTPQPFAPVFTGWSGPEESANLEEVSEAQDYQKENEEFAGSAPAPAVALEVEVMVTLKEALKGCTKELLVADPVSCTECTGMKPVARMQCSQCRGVGTYNVDRKEEIDLPSGMYEGMEISKPGQGRYDVRAGRNGDLIVKIKLAPHPLLGVNGKDITCSVPVTIYEAMLGAEIEAPCATGKVTMKIQPLTQPGRVYRLKGLGLDGADQLVTIEVVLPSRLSGEEVAAYKRLRDMFHEANPRDKYFQQRQSP